LLGIYHESQRQWRLARKFYARAIAVDAEYEPAQTNLRRLREINRNGQSMGAAALGDDRDARLIKNLDDPRETNNQPNS
jgi:hypothetical protein